MARRRLDVLRVFGPVLLALAIGCGGSEPDPPAEPVGAGTVASGTGVATRAFEQSFVFASITEDSVFLVPWLIGVTSRPDGVVREARGWLARSSTWDAFYSEEWRTPPSRVPARFLPHGNLQLLVQEGDVVDGIIFDDGSRSLEVTMGEVRASWGGPRGETVEILDGAAFLADDRVDGVVLHLGRASTGGEPLGGDWAMVLSGDSAQFVFTADVEHGGEAEPLYRGWGTLEGTDVQWPELYLEWTATQAFPPARRDIPAAWRLWSADGQVEGDLRAVSSDIEAGPGSEPLLPVRALFEVVGQISTEEGDFPLHGLLVHERR